MAKAKKSYSDLQADIEKLFALQDALKAEKLNVFIKEFQKKDFQEKLVNVDDKVLKQVAKSIVENFESLVEKVSVREQKQALSQPDNIENQVTLSQPNNNQNTTPFVEPTTIQ